MLDAAIVNQLKSVYAELSADLTFRVQPSEHAKQAELLDMLRSLASTSPKIAVDVSGAPSSVPRFELLVDGEPSGIAFTGIPGGHEFTSLVLAVLNADGKGKLPDDATTARIRRLKGPIRLRTFVSLSCENCPDVVQALNQMALLHPDFTHEMVDGGYVPGEVDALGIRGVPSVQDGNGLVASGKTTLGALLAKLEDRMGSEEVTEVIDLGHKDVVVVGGGPAGASAAIYTARKGLETVVLTDRLGGQLQDTKGIENLISIPYTEGPTLSADLGKHLDAAGVKLLDNRRVVEVVPGSPVRLKLDSGETLTTTSLVLATGAKWRELGVEGEKAYLGQGVAFCPHCDGPLFKGKDIAVVGGGNSGVEAAIDLANIVRSVTVLEFASTPKADAVLLEKLAGLSNTKLITNARTDAILGDGKTVNALRYEDRSTGEMQTLELAGVFVQIGLVPNSGFVKDLVETNRFGEIVVDEKGRTSVPGIYAAGDVTTVPYKQIIVAMGEGAKAGLAAFEDTLLA